MDENTLTNINPEATSTFSLFFFFYVCDSNNADKMVPQVCDNSESFYKQKDLLHILNKFAV